MFFPFLLPTTHVKPGLSVGANISLAPLQRGIGLAAVVKSHTMVSFGVEKCGKLMHNVWYWFKVDRMSSCSHW